MNGHCDFHTFERAVDVCGICFGDLCRSCALSLKGRKDSVCKDCALTVSGVRGGGKPEVRGDRRTMKQRREEYAAAGPAEDFFQFFDADLPEDALVPPASPALDGQRQQAGEGRAVDGSGGGHESEPTGTGIRKLLGRRKSEESAVEGDDFVAISDVLGSDSDESGESGRTKDADAVSQLADIRRRGRAAVSDLSRSRQAEDTDEGDSIADAAPPDLVSSYLASSDLDSDDRSEPSETTAHADVEAADDATVIVPESLRPIVDPTGPTGPESGIDVLSGSDQAGTDERGEPDPVAAHLELPDPVDASLGDNAEHRPNVDQLPAPLEPRPAPEAEEPPYQSTEPPTLDIQAAPDSGQDVLRQSDLHDLFAAEYPAGEERRRTFGPVEDFPDEGTSSIEPDRKLDASDLSRQVTGISRSLREVVADLSGRNAEAPPPRNPFLKRSTIINEPEALPDYTTDPFAKPVETPATSTPEPGSPTTTPESSVAEPSAFATEVSQDDHLRPIDDILRPEDEPSIPAAGTYLDPMSMPAPAVEPPSLAVGFDPLDEPFAEQPGLDPAHQAVVPPPGSTVLPTLADDSAEWTAVDDVPDLDGTTPKERADVDARGSWIPPALRGIAPDAAEAGERLPRRRR